MAFVKPTLAFHLGLTAGFRDALSTVVWTNITSYVESWGTSRGREPKKPPSHFEPGTATLLLNNRDRRFDPTNTASPYSPNLKPARVRLRIRANYLGITYDVFTGYVKRWPPQWTATATSTVAITAVDALGAPLNLAHVFGSPWETAVRHDDPIMWLRMAESGSATVATDASLSHNHGQYQGTPSLGLDGLIGTETSDKAARFVTGSRVSIPNKNMIPGYPFTFECWFTCAASTVAAKMFISAYDGPSAGWRQYLQIFVSSAEPGKIVVVVANPAPTTGTQVASSITVNDTRLHHLAVVCATSTNFKIYIDGVDRTGVPTIAVAHAFPNDLITGYAVGNNPAAAFGDFRFGYEAGDVLAEPILYDTALTGARIAEHYLAGVGHPANLRNPGSVVTRLLEEADWPADYVVDDGESLLQDVSVAGSVVANLQKVEDSEQGALFVNESGVLVFQGRYAMLAAPYDTSQITLQQGVGTLVYEPPVVWGNDDTELYNEASGSRIGGPTYIVRDEASIATYGERSLSTISGLWNERDGEVVDLLTYRVNRYAQPVSSVRQVRLHPAAVVALYPYVLGLGLRSKVTVKVAPPGGGTAFEQVSRIERITHDVDDKGDWWTTWDISAAETAAVFTLNHATLGVLDAGVLVGF